MNNGKSGKSGCATRTPLRGLGGAVTKLKSGVRKIYAAHEARVAALRVYSRDRIDRDRSTEAGR